MHHEDGCAIIGSSQASMDEGFIGSSFEALLEIYSNFFDGLFI